MTKVAIIVNAHYKTAKFAAQIVSIAGELKKIGLTVEIALADEFFDGKSINADGVLFWDKDILLAKRLAKAARVFNPPESIKVCDDKAETIFALRDAGVAVPETFVAPFTYPNIPYEDFGFLEVAEKRIGYPMVIKRSKSSLGMGVYLAKNSAEAQTVIAEAASCGERALIEEFVSECAGTDVRILVIGGSAVCAMKRINENDFRSNVEQGGVGYAYEPTAEEKAVAEKAARVLNLDYAGVDVLQTKGGAKVIEVNSNAFFSELQKVSGVNIAEKYAQYVKTCLEKR